MFNIEIIKIILDSKQNELEELENQQRNITGEDGNQILLLDAHAGDSRIEIENKIKEINYLKAITIRYEIARLLGLDNDSSYKSVNFLGIEEENIYDFNLTPEQIATYNSLKSQIPREQLQRYKIRRELSTILGDDNSKEFKEKDYEGIEEVNPNLLRYNLNQEDIRKFTDLVDGLTRIDADTTKSVNVYKETIRLIEDAFNKLNIDDVNEYRRIKEEYLEKIDKLLAGVSEEDKNNLFTDTSNYELASDLKTRHEDLTVKLGMHGVENLFNLLNTTRVDDDKYNEYIDMLCNNIIELYNDENNRETLENLINSVNINRYNFRHDLDSRLSMINNLNIGLQDNELERFVRYLNEHYNELDETTRDKYYDLLSKKINADINNLDKVDFINSVMLQVTNKDLSIRLQNEFISNDNIKFSNRHLSSYNSLVQDTIAKLNSKKQEYVSKKGQNDFLAAYYDSKILEIDKEIERVNSLNENYDDSNLIENINNKYNDKTTKIIELKKEIKELEELKNQLRSGLHKKIVDKKISNRNEEIRKLKESKNKMVGSQKKIMVPKLWLDQKRGKTLRRYEARAEVSEMYSNDYRRLAETERHLNGMFSPIKAMFYDYKANRFESKAAFNSKICEILSGANVRVNGANRHLINGDVLNQIRNNQHVQAQTM